MVYLLAKDMLIAIPQGLLLLLVHQWSFTLTRRHHNCILPSIHLKRNWLVRLYPLPLHWPRQAMFSILSQH